MKNTDLFTKRLLSVSLGLSAVLLSASLLVFSLRGITPAQAGSFPENTNSGISGVDMNMNLPLKLRQAVPADTLDEDIQAIQAFGLGMRDGVIYFGILYNNNTVGLHKTEFNSEDILHW